LPKGIVGVVNQLREKRAERNAPAQGVKS
jgi:hypothetical protein